MLSYNTKTRFCLSPRETISRKKTSWQLFARYRRHISITDPGLFGSTYEDGLKREINEEVIIDSPYTQRVVALLNDDSNDVGKVHFGVVHVLTLDKPLVKPREKSINETIFLGIVISKKM